MNMNLGSIFISHKSFEYIHTQTHWVSAWWRYL